MRKKFIRKLISCFFETHSLFFLKIVNFFQIFPYFPNFYISVKFLLSFLKIISKFFIFQNFTKNFGIPTSVLLCLSTVFLSFFTTDDISRLHHYVHRATSKILEVFPKLHLNFITTLSIDLRMSQ